MTALLIASIALAASLIALVAAGHALLTKRDSQSALGWVLLILFVPYLGSLVYLLFGVSRINSQAARLMRKAALSQHASDATLDAKLSPEEIQNPSLVLANVGQLISGEHVLAGNNVTLLQNGEQAYPRMLEAIHQATSQVYLSTYIFKSGEVGEAFAKALARAAERGVDTRLIVDGLGGSLYSLRKPWKHLAKHGVKVARFLPPQLLPPTFSVNLRTHRKVLVCDGNVGFTGGMNIGDHHLVSKPGKHRVQDIHFRCQGPIAARLQEAFLMDWTFVTHEPSTAAALPSTINPTSPGDSHCRLVFDGLGQGRDNIHDLLCGVISAAKHNVRIMTPYFLPPRELTSALTSAALRGVTVELILPAENNLKYVHWATQHILEQFIQQGVQLYWQPAPFAHTKLLLVDNVYTLVGSANLDPRSLFLNFELNLEIFNPTFNAEMAAYFSHVQSTSRQAALSDFTSRSLLPRLRDAAFWIFSPYM